MPLPIGSWILFIRPSDFQWLHCDLIWQDDTLRVNVYISCSKPGISHSLICFMLYYSYGNLKAIILIPLKEETDRTGSILKAGLPLAPDGGLWAIMPSIYGNDIPTWKPGARKEEPQGLYLDSPLPKEYPNYLCNRIESNSIMLIRVWPQAYWYLSTVNYLGLRHMNHGLTLTVSFFSFVQASFREFGEVPLGSDT